MDPETRLLLKDLLKKTEENNKLIKKIHKSLVAGRIFKLLYWGVIIGVAIIGYFTVKPLFESVLNTYQGISGQVSETQENLTNFGGGLGSFLNFGSGASTSE